MPKTLTFMDEQYTADKIIKTEDSIIGYIEGKETPEFTFKGISDFSLFTLAEGEEWDVLPKSEVELLQKQLIVANNQIDSLILQLGDSLLTSITPEQYNTLVETNTSLVSQVEQLTIALGDLILNGGV